MIGFTLNEEQEALRGTVEDFARQVVAPVIGGYYERGEFPYEIVARMARLGLFGLPFPEDYGGMGGDYFAFCLALHELARVDSSVAITLEAAVGLGAMPIFRFGSAAQRERWLPDLCRGERLAAFGLTEPGGGSDIPGGMRTTARLDGDQWVIDGSKAFITNSGTSITSVVTALAITGRAASRPEISAIMVPAGTPGFTVGPEYSKVGWCASDTRELAFSGCRVPSENLLGELGRGYAQFLQTLDEGRVAIAALAAGLAQGCIDECLRYVRQRTAFGHELGHYQAIQFRIADMEARAHGRPAGLVRRGGQAGGRRGIQEASRDREADLLERSHGQCQGRHPDLRRLRVHERVPGGQVLPGRQGTRNRRGHVRSAAHGDRPPAGPGLAGIGPVSYGTIIRPTPSGFLSRCSSYMIRATRSRSLALVDVGNVPMVTSAACSFVRPTGDVCRVC